MFDYLDGAADDEVTLKDSENAFREVVFKPHFAVATPACDLGVTVLGHKLDVPFMLGPIGYSRLMHPRGELAASAAAGRHGTAYILSTLSGHRMEDVKAQSPGPTFYQLYLAGGRGAAEGAIARAKAAGYAGAVRHHRHAGRGNRERDVRNGMKELMGSNPFKKLNIFPTSWRIRAGWRPSSPMAWSGLFPMSFCRDRGPWRRSMWRRRWNRRKCPGPISNGSASCGTAPS